jgi:hypothetical protein
MSEVRDAGLASYETMVVMRKSIASPSVGNAGRSSDSHVEDIDDI